MVGQAHLQVSAATLAQARAPPPHAGRPALRPPASGPSVSIFDALVELMSSQCHPVTLCRRWSWPSPRYGRSSTGPTSTSPCSRRWISSPSSGRWPAYTATTSASSPGRSSCARRVTASTASWPPPPTRSWPASMPTPATSSERHSCPRRSWSRPSMAGGARRSATCARTWSPGRPAYVDRILEPAQQYGFPNWYLDRLGRLRT